MGINNITKTCTRETWIKFSRNFKKKDEKDKDKLVNLARGVNTLEYITIGQMTKTNFFGFKDEIILKEPEMESTCTLLILCNDGYPEKDALRDMGVYLKENPDMGILGLHLELSIKLYEDLQVNSQKLSTCIELRDKYIASIKGEKNKDTQDE